MKYKNAPGNLSRIIKRAVIVTVILALIEVVIIYFIMADKKPKVDEPAIVEQIKTEQPKAAAPQTIESAADNIVRTDTLVEKPEPLPEAKPISIINSPVKQDTLVKPVAAKKKEEQTLKKLPAPAEKIIETNLNQQAMADILGKIVAAKSRLSKDTKCVQIRKSKNSNVKNAFEIGNYLKTQGYVISGRELSSQNYKGVLVEANGPCIKLTIGKL